MFDPFPDLFGPIHCLGSELLRFEVGLHCLENVMTGPREVMTNFKKEVTNRKKEVTNRKREVTNRKRETSPCERETSPCEKEGTELNRDLPFSKDLVTEADGKPSSSKTETTSAPVQCPSPANSLSAPLCLCRSTPSSPTSDPFLLVPSCLGGSSTSLCASAPLRFNLPSFLLVPSCLGGYFPPQSSGERTPKPGFTITCV